MKNAIYLTAGVSLAAILVAGCGLLQTGTAAAVDGLADYCAANPTAAGRAELRGLVRNEINAEGLELCLGCPGEALTHCVGHARTKVDDS